MTIRYTTGPEPAYGVTFRDREGPSHYRVTPEGIHAHLNGLGYDAYSLNDVALWMSGDAPADARTLHTVEDMEQVERSLATAFLKHHGKNPAPIPPGSPDRESVYKIATDLAAKKFSRQQFDEWADRPGYGAVHFKQLYDASKLPFAERSTARAFLRSAKLPLK